MITIPTKLANYDQENIKFVHNLSYFQYFCFGNKLFSSFVVRSCLIARIPKRNKRKVVPGSRVTLPVNFACKPVLSFHPLARVILAVGLLYVLVNRAFNLLLVIHFSNYFPTPIIFRSRIVSFRIFLLCFALKAFSFTLFPNGNQ